MKFVCLIILSAISLVACSQNAPAPAPSRTIAYFIEHEAERDSVITTCKSAQSTTPAQSEECGTAMVADQQVAREAYMKQRLRDKARR
jgi:hypothetical protein